jgi:hypothetical protein
VEFTLCYRGPLKATTKSNQRVEEKHALRRAFHEQLSRLWSQKPLSDHPEFLEPGKETATRMANKESDKGMFMTFEDITLLRDYGGIEFVPTVSADLNMVADLTITLLRPEPPGRIVTQGGDIDNRLKTLLDSLKVPREAEIPTSITPSNEPSPLFCLLEDDNLITNLDIKTDRLLDSAADSSEVLLLIHVRTRVLQGTWANLGLI